MTYTLEAVTRGGWHRYPVTFSTPYQALEFMSRKAATTTLIETSEHQIVPAGRIGPLTVGELALLDALYPSCHHGLSLELCMDPYGEHHWGTREQELAGQI